MGKSTVRLEYKCGIIHPNHGYAIFQIAKVACEEEESIGDTSTLNDPSVVSELINNRRKN